MSREKILRYYRSSGDEELAARLLDLAEHSVRNNKYKISAFLDPYGYSIAETICAHYDNIEIVSFGGYAGAERVKVAFVNSDFKGKVDFCIEAISARWDSRYHDNLSHRDILGAIMGIGIKRDVIGDIVSIPSGCQIVIDSCIMEYISRNLTSIGSAPIEIDRIELTELKPREERVKEIKTTVASLRLDVVAAAGFGTSRTKMSSEIQSEKVKVNWKISNNAAYNIKSGDVISIRGRGRVEVADIIGQTKKGRISLILKRYI